MFEFQKLRQYVQEQSVKIESNRLRNKVGIKNRSVHVHTFFL
jgi:hypothetical protein